VRPGFWLALGYATALAFFRVIDVTESGPAMMLFGTSFSAVAGATAWLRPRWFPLLLVAYLPFSRAYALPVLGITGANMTNLLIALGFLAWAVDRTRRPRRLRVGGAEKLLVAYVAVASLSVIQTRLAGWSPMDVAQTYRSWLAPILFFFIVRGLARDRHDVWATLRVMAWATVLVAGITWIEGLGRSNRGTIDAARVPGLMGQANTMGAFLAYYGSPLLALAVTVRPWRRRLPYLAGFLVAARASLFTFSRGAYLSMAAGSATVLLFGNPLLLAAAGGGGLGAAAVFPGLVPDSVVDRMKSISERQVYAGQSVEQRLDKSSAHRLVIWHGAGKMIAQHPLQGVGMGLFPYVIGDYTEVPIREGDPTDAHNAFIRVAAEMGLPALALLMLLLLAYTRLALWNFFRRRAIPDRPVALASLGSLAALFVSCMLGSRFSDESLIGGFWILMALLVVVDRLPGPPRRAPRVAWR
jgi:O-antigen ligase